MFGKAAQGTLKTKTKILKLVDKFIYLTLSHSQGHKFQKFFLFVYEKINGSNRKLQMPYAKCHEPT